MGLYRSLSENEYTCKDETLISRNFHKFFLTEEFIVAYNKHLTKELYDSLIISIMNSDEYHISNINKIYKFIINSVLKAARGKGSKKRL